MTSTPLTSDGATSGATAHDPSTTADTRAAVPVDAPAGAPARTVLGIDVVKAVRFLVVGGVSAVIDLGLLVTLRDGLGINLQVAITVAYVVSLAVNFVLNRTWSFGSTGVATPMARYAVMVAVYWSLTQLVVTGGVAIGVPYVIGKILAIGLGAIVNFVAYDRWVFADA